MKKIYSDDSIITLRNLVERKEDSNYIIGDESTEIYASISPETYEILKLFKKQLKVKKIKHLAKKRFGKVDIDAFINNLLKHNFVSAIDGRNVFDYSKVKFKSEAHLLSPGTASVFFSPPAYILYIAVVLYAGAILVLNPHYLPKYADYFFLKRKSVQYL
jgi:hypothetical protein